MTAEATFTPCQGNFIPLGILDWGTWTYPGGNWHMRDMVATDEDATSMRMKEDHLQTAQLKAAYNVQMGTESQFVVGYSVHQQASDSACLVPPLETVQETAGQFVWRTGRTTPN